VAAAKRRRIGWFALLAVALALAATAILWRLTAPSTASFIEYPMLEPRDVPTAIAAAHDGTIWFTIDLANAIGRIRNGKVERLIEHQGNLEPIGIAVDAQGAAWYTDAQAKEVTRVLPSGEMTSIALQTPVARLGHIAAAPDGSVWFSEATAYSISRIKDGKLERHVIDSIRALPLGVAVAPDNTVWATLQGSNQLLHIAPGGEMKAFDIPTRGSLPADVAVDANGTVWFLEFRGNKIGRFAGGRFEEFSAGDRNVGLTGLALAQDGSVWVGMLRRGSLGRFRHGKLQEFKLPRPDPRPYSVTVDREGNVWYTDIRGFVGMLPARDAQR